MGSYGEKIECANHAIKCYRNRLEKITQDFPKYKGKGKLTQQVIQRLTAGARCAIKMHKESNNVVLLRADLRNGPSHVFNDHSNCNPSFCKMAAQTKEPASAPISPISRSGSNSSMPDTSIWKFIERMTYTWKKTKQGEGIVASSAITYLMIFTSAFKELEIGWLVWLPN